MRLDSSSLVPSGRGDEGRSVQPTMTPDNQVRRRPSRPDHCHHSSDPVHWSWPDYRSKNRRQPDFDGKGSGRRHKASCVGEAARLRQCPGRWMTEVESLSGLGYAGLIADHTDRRT
jgi:5-methylcytosine-specific restriction endonuclease McrA